MVVLLLVLLGFVGGVVITGYVMNENEKTTPEEEEIKRMISNRLCALEDESRHHPDPLHWTRDLDLTDAEWDMLGR